MTSPQAGKAAWRLAWIDRLAAWEGAEVVFATPKGDRLHNSFLDALRLALMTPGEWRGIADRLSGCGRVYALHPAAARPGPSAPLCSLNREFNMNPIAVAEVLRDSYIAYLTSTFGMFDATPALHDQFVKLLETPGQLVIGPYLEATPPYEQAKVTLADVVGAEKLLHPGFESLLAKPSSTTLGKPVRFGFGQSVTQKAGQIRDRLPGSRRLYSHQVAALDRLCGQPEVDRDRHTVVSSGTGSGKTECFLLPAIDWVLRHPTRTVKEGILSAGNGRGLRVLLVYPMNALVNDQIRRLRHLVGFRKDRGEAAVPLTFARYTSETKEKLNEARQREPDAPDNQLLVRDEIIDSPPDILITNFAMLEQALLRPLRETPLFESMDQFAWRFLILDEAHSYRGAQAIELAASDARRGRASRGPGRGQRKVGVAERGPICIATKPPP